MFDRREIKRVSGESIECVGRHSHNAAAADEVGCVVHDVRFRRFGRDFQYFNGQIVRSRRVTPPVLTVGQRTIANARDARRRSWTNLQYMRHRAEVIPIIGAHGGCVYDHGSVCYACMMSQRFPLSAEHGDLIASRDNRWLKRFRSAMRGAGPAEGEPLGVEGRKLVEDALRSGLECEAILVSASAESTLKEILDVASTTETGISRLRILRTTDKLFASASGTDTPQGIAALFQTPGWQFEDSLCGLADEEGAFPGTSPLVVVMVGVQDPGNVGTIVRSAEAFGATGAVAARGTADPWSPKALRASAGSALRLPLLRDR